MADTRAEIWNWLLVPVMATVLAILFVPMLYDWESHLLYALLLGVTLCHIHFGVFVVSPAKVHALLIKILACLILSFCETFARHCVYEMDSTYFKNILFIKH